MLPQSQWWPLMRACGQAHGRWKVPRGLMSFLNSKSMEYELFFWKMRRAHKTNINANLFPTESNELYAEWASRTLNAMGSDISTPVTHAARVLLPWTLEPGKIPVRFEINQRKKTDFLQDIICEQCYQGCFHSPFFGFNSSTTSVKELTLSPFHRWESRGRGKLAELASGWFGILLTAIWGAQQVHGSTLVPYGWVLTSTGMTVVCVD